MENGGVQLVTTNESIYSFGLHLNNNEQSVALMLNWPVECVAAVISTRQLDASWPRGCQAASPSASVISPQAGESPKAHITLVTESRGIPSKSRQVLRQSSSSIVSFHDTDTMLTRDWSGYVVLAPPLSNGGDQTGHRICHREKWERTREQGAVASWRTR